MRILISRTDSIGDVVLTLPVAGILKQTFPGCTIIFLGREYTRAVIEACAYVDQFVARAPPPAAEMPPPRPPTRGKYPLPDPHPTRREYPHPDPPPTRGREVATRMLTGLKADVILHVFPVKEICEAAKRAKIPLRIATAGRFFTWFTCNRLLHIPRKNSNLHEAQLNLKILKGLGIDREFKLEEIGELYGLTGGKVENKKLQITNYELPELSGIPRPTSFVPRPTSHVPRPTSFILRPSLILHPKSKGSAREWGLDNFSRLIELLAEDEFDILVTGTKEEGAMMQEFLKKHGNRITDLTGKLSLPEFISLISECNGLVAASTGPLHLAAALGIRAVGLYAPMRPIFPQRWAPVGPKASFLCIDKKCSDCRKTMDCSCIRSISPEKVVEKLRQP